MDRVDQFSLDPSNHTCRGKRPLDLVVTLAALIVLAPVLALLALLVRLKLGAPVLFRQQRPGLYSRPFTIYKFRTMTDGRDAQGKLLPDAERLTPFGCLLRSTSMDELPELFNVLMGNMSLVGPRPLLMQYLDRYTLEQARRHEVRPGITGWAQVNGRNAITWEEKFALDVWYVDHQSLWLDVKIIGLSVWKILKREGISHPGHTTMEEFMGSKSEMRVLILGAGGHAQVVADILLRMGEAGANVTLVGYLDDAPSLAGRRFLDLPVLGGISELSVVPHDAVTIAIGDNTTRQELFHKLQDQGECFAIARHPSAVVAPDASIGPGSIICAGAVVNPGSVIGANVILNTGCTVDHHNRISDHVHVAPGVHLGGNVTISEGAFIGIGSTVIPGRIVGAWATVGAGSVVTKDIPDYVRAVGVPARVIGKREM